MTRICRIASALFRLLPRCVGDFVALLLGLFWFHAVRVRRSVAMENLRIAFGQEKSYAELRRVARRSFVNLALSVIDSLRLPALDRQKVEKMMAFSGEENLRKAIEARRGVIAITGHFGSFDLLCCAYALRGYPLTIVTKALRSRALNELWQKERARCGLRQVPMRGSVKPLLRALRDGEIVGIVIDQRPLPDAAVVASLFGRPVLTTPAPAVLAERTGAAVLPAFICRKDGGRHEVLIGEDLGFSRSGGSREQDILANTERYNRALEAAIRAAPDHWMWVHRRWKMPPPAAEQGAEL